MYRFTKHVQRIFKCGNMPNTRLIPDKEVNILIYMEHRSHYILEFLTC